MSSFNPLNVIIEDQSEDEIDDSKEIQVEEALKLYQNALRLHAQGPQYFDQADEAYKELFRSEIFTYPESLSERKWLEVYGGTEVESEDEELLPDEKAPVAATDGSSNTLPQLLYLAYKNYGQFRLDRLRERLQQVEAEVSSSDDVKARKEISEWASTGLENIAEALARDDTDLELWRKLSRVSEFMGSNRLSRYCLETVVDGFPQSGGPNVLGLEEKFALAQLQALLPKMRDDAGESSVDDHHATKSLIPHSMKPFIDPLPFLAKSMGYIANQPSKDQVKHIEVEVSKRDWLALGQAILKRIRSERQDSSRSMLGFYHFHFLGSGHDIEENDSEDESYATPPDGNTIAKEASQAQGPKELQEEIKNVVEESQTATNAEFTPEIPQDAREAAPEDQTMLQDTKTKETEQDTQSTREEPTKGNELVLPSRKRPSEDVDPEPNEGSRGRSKRIKTRASMAESGTKAESAEDWSRWYEEQLKLYSDADNSFFEVIIKLLDQLRGDQNMIPTKSAIAEKAATNGETKDADRLQGKQEVAGHYLKDLLEEWDLHKSRAFLSARNTEDKKSKANAPTFHSFFEPSNPEEQERTEIPGFPEDHNIDSFMQEAQSEPFLRAEEAGYLWLRNLLSSAEKTESRSPYQNFRWSAGLKELVVQMLLEIDEYVLRCSRIALEQINSSHTEFIEAIFELHIEIYGTLTNLDSSGDASNRALQGYRLSQWASLAHESISETASAGNRDGADSQDIELFTRFMWATTLSNSLLDPSSTESTITCYKDIAKFLREQAQIRKISGIKLALANNSMIPEISATAAESEVTKLITLEFFSNIFNGEHEDPFVIIDSLEPVLSYSATKPLNESSELDLTTDAATGQPATTVPLDSAILKETLGFVENTSISFKLYLWEKLGDAYGQVPYPPMLLSCRFRSLALLVRYLNSQQSSDNSKSDSDSFLNMLGKIDELMSQCIPMLIGNIDIFECFDHQQLLATLDVIGSLVTTLQTFASWEDSIRVGKVQPPAQPTAAATKLQTRAADKFRDMIVRAWTMQYLVFKEAAKVDGKTLEAIEAALLDYLKAAHRALGLRTYCGLANRTFLKLAKAEMLRMKPIDGWDDDLPQIIYDLYGLTISSDSEEIQEHSCETSEIDKATAFEAVDLVISNANQLNTKDLLKSELKVCIDELQDVIKKPKPSKDATARNFNKKLVGEYLKSLIHPVELLRAARGIGGLPTSVAQSEGAIAARKSWYFLVGHVSLCKFRSQKRTSAGSTEDLDRAQEYFLLDLEFDADKWETWFRLAQVYDSMLDEKTTWTSEKLENNTNELVKLQRQSILAYSMALALGVRSSTASFEETQKIGDLFYDFGSRVYSSSREPFSMRVFSTDDSEKPYNSASRGMYKSQAFKPLSLYGAWKFASGLLRRASIQRPDSWATSYLLGKVLWKMYSCDDDVLGKYQRISYETVIDSLVRAIELLPQKRDTRHSEKDPILEPHYKLLSIVHKLVRGKSCSAEEGCRILRASPYAQRATEVQDPDEWVDYVEEVLKSLRAADRSNWHHRMVARAAQTIYETDPNDLRAWLGAKHELTQQIFTKTMTIQVWKPDNERPGRHFVYTGRYVRFFVHILTKLKDKESLEALAKRIRKRTGDFVNHGDVWRDLATAYLNVLRTRIAVQVQAGFEPGYGELYFKFKTYDEMAPNAARLESWAHAPDTNSIQLDTLRDAIEFKKLNNNLLKTSIVEELIADLYAVIYHTNVKELRAKESAEENRNRMRVDNILMASTPENIKSENETGIAGADEAGKDASNVAKRRTTTITHREIIRRADALMVKLPSIATPRTSARPLLPNEESNGTPSVAVVIPAREGFKDTASAPLSPLSVHDSADDESELSEADEGLDDEEMAGEARDAISSQRQLFPNLPSMPNNPESSDIEEEEPVEDVDGDEEDEGHATDASNEGPTAEHEEQGSAVDETAAEAKEVDDGSKDT